MNLNSPVDAWRTQTGMTVLSVIKEELMRFSIVYAIPYFVQYWHVIQTFKAMDDIGVVMTPFGDVVTVILVVNSYVARGNDKN